MTQVTVLIEGGEYTVNTLSSFDMQHVTRDAAKLLKELGEEEPGFSKDTVKNACLAAAVLKSSTGEVVFPSGLEILKGLTDEQIATVSDAYAMLAQRTAGSIFGENISEDYEWYAEQEQKRSSLGASGLPYGFAENATQPFFDSGNIKEVILRASGAAVEQQLSDTVEGQMLRLVADTSEVQR